MVTYSTITIYKAKTNYMGSTYTWRNVKTFYYQPLKQLSVSLT